MSERTSVGINEKIVPGAKECCCRPQNYSCSCVMCYKTTKQNAAPA